VKIVPKSLTFAALALVAVTATAASRPAWISQVVQTEGGGHRMGNPKAKVAVIEFSSYTCPHCATFHKQSDAPLKLAYVSNGKASVEVRHVLRNTIDLTAALTAECGPETKFVGNHNALMISHDQWMKRLEGTTAATQARWQSGTFGERMRAVASDAGFYDIMEQRGYDRVALNKCLSDEVSAKRIAQQSEASSNAFGVQGTPSFAVNGKLLDDVHTWDSLQKAIASAL
jgi:protein-disulfide isomerase